MRAPQRGNEQLVAAWTGTKRFFQNCGWALTLALRLNDFFDSRPLAHQLGSPLGRLPLANPLAISTTLLTATLAPTLCLLPSLAGTPMPPAVRGTPTHQTAIPRLGIFGLEELLATF